MWGRGPEVSWQTGQRDITAQNKRRPGWSLALYILYTAALSMLSLYAAAGMAASQLNVRLGEGQRGCVLVLVSETLLILIWNEVMHVLGKRKLRWTGNLVLLGIVLWGCFRYYHGLAGELTGGFYSLGQRYMDIWNHYFQTTYQLEPGDVSGEPLAWGLLLIAVTTLLQTVSALLRKRTIMLILPVTVLTAEMTVGLTPGWRELACMSVAGLLGLYLDLHREFQAFPALLLAALLGLGLPLIALLWTGPASKVNQLHERLQAFQHQIEYEIQDFDWQELWHREGQVDNHSPQYEKKTMLTVKVNIAPAQVLYLRGYCGTDYRKGSWDTSEKDFNRVSLLHGLSGSRAAELLAGLSSLAHASYLEDKLHYELQYTGLHNHLAYLPYGADLDTAQNSYKLSGDYVVEKSASLESFVFEGWNPGLLARDGSDIQDSDAGSFYLWYNEYVRTQYMAVPGDMPNLTDMVNTLETHAECRTALERLERGDAAARNAARLYLGSLVADQLRAGADYSLEPGSLPWGMDPIEYFLGENRKGYCVHFASAGVLLLRRLGVPARYVSGYVVPVGQFARSADGYMASVKDESAHAWAEIWLDNVGWVPVEMTPGYDNAGVELPGQDSPPPYQMMEDSLPETTEAPEPEMPSAENQEPETLGATAAPSLTPQDISGENGASGETEKNPENPPEGALGVNALGEAGGPGGGEQQGWGFAGEGGWSAFGQNGSLRVSDAVGLLGMAVMVWVCRRVVPLVRRHWVSWPDKIKADIESGSVRKAIRLINRRLYRQLWRKRMGMPALRSDEEYLAALKQQYPQMSEAEWEMYLSVVRKAVYSREELSAREAVGCLAVLRRTKSG